MPTTEICFRNIKHGFRPGENPAIYGECDGTASDSLHFAVAATRLNYPFNYGPIPVNKPKLIYIDRDGMLVQLSLTSKEVQNVIDIRNTNEVLAHAEEIENGNSNAAYKLKPPRS